MDCQIVAFVIFHFGGEVWVGVDVVFMFSPVEFVEPLLFGIGDPVPGNSIATINRWIRVFEVRRGDWGEFEKCLEVLELLLIDVSFERFER